MERIHKLWGHPLYQEQFTKLQQAESERIFCSHTLSHFLDVARLAYIYSLEEQIPVDKEIIYAAALLHDVGRYRQIADSTPHDRASAALAGAILPDCGFAPYEVEAIQDAILHHRGGQKSSGAGSNAADTRPAPHNALPWHDKLAIWLYRADKQSRCCFACSAAKECNWSEEKKNLRILL